jgi:hypothetical protein
MRLSNEQRRFLGHLAVGLAFLALTVPLRRNLFVDALTAAYFVLLADSFRTRRPAQERVENFIVGVTLLLFPLMILPLAFQIEIAVRPHILDAELRAADLWLGLDGFALSRFCIAHLWARWLMTVVYALLPLEIALSWIVGRSHAFLRGAVIGAAVALPCYLLCPAVGPQYVYEGWPAPVVSLVAAAAGAHPRNCMPSMHFTWAALAALNVPARWRPPFFLYAALIGLAAVSTGEHYCIDVIAAISYCAALQWWVHRKWKPPV